jgi:hypothetical protein
LSLVEVAVEPPVLEVAVALEVLSSRASLPFLEQSVFALAQVV